MLRSLTVISQGDWQRQLDNGMLLLFEGILLAVLSVLFLWLWPLDQTVGFQRPLIGLLWSLGLIIIAGGSSLILTLGELPYLPSYSPSDWYRLGAFSRGEIVVSKLGFVLAHSLVLIALASPLILLAAARGGIAFSDLPRLGLAVVCSSITLGAVGLYLRETVVRTLLTAQTCVVLWLAGLLLTQALTGAAHLALSYHGMVLAMGVLLALDLAFDFRSLLFR